MWSYVKLWNNTDIQVKIECNVQEAVKNNYIYTDSYVNVTNWKSIQYTVVAVL